MGIDETPKISAGIRGRVCVHNDSNRQKWQIVLPYHAPDGKDRPLGAELDHLISRGRRASEMSLLGIVRLHILEFLQSRDPHGIAGLEELQYVKPNDA